MKTTRARATLILNFKKMKIILNKDRKTPKRSLINLKGTRMVKDGEDQNRLQITNLKITLVFSKGNKMCCTKKKPD